MAKTKPIGVRFDEVLMGELKERNLVTSPQSTLSFLEEYYKFSKIMNSRPVIPKEEKKTEYTALVGKQWKEIVNEVTGEAKENILRQIESIKNETVPAYQNTPLGKKSFEFDRQKRILELEKQLK